MSLANNHARLALPAHSSVMMPAEPYSGHDQTGHPLLNPDFAFARNDYCVRLASEGHPLYSQAGRLVARMYDWRGLRTSGLARAGGRPEDKRRERVTLAASRSHHLIGTLTLGVDSDTGLLAESLYRPEVEALRKRGGRLCEVTRLALDPKLSGREVMATLFHVAFVLSSEVYDRTDLLAEVHPRHAGFYRRTMGYRIAGPERICPRVGAPAVLMHLCLDYARSQIREFSGTCPRRDRNLYRRFLPAAEQEVLMRKLTGAMTVLSD